MTDQPLPRWRHRKPRWHDRPRAWLRTTLDWLSGREEEWDGRDDHGNHIGGDLPPVQRWPQPERPVIRTAEVDGVHLPLSDDQPYNPAWMPCWSRPDVPREVMPDAEGGSVPGRTRAHIDGGQPAGKDGSRCDSGVAVGSRELAPPVAALSAFASPFGAPGRIPPTPRPPREPVTWWRPRECGGRIALAVTA